MVAEKHFDNDSVKSCDFWHLVFGSSLKDRLYCIGRLILYKRGFANAPIIAFTSFASAQKFSRSSLLVSTSAYSNSKACDAAPEISS